MELKITEGTVQCELYRRLSNIGYSVISEMKIGRLRADLAIIQYGKPIRLIEVKRAQRKAEVNNNTRQKAKYIDSEIPFIYCRGFEDIERVLNIIQRLHPV